MRQVLKTLFTCLLITVVCSAQQAGTTTTEKKAKKRASSQAAVSEQLSQMQGSIDEQQKQIRQLLQELHSRDSEIQGLQQKMDDLQKTVGQAQQKADTAASVSEQQQADVASVKTNVSDLQTTMTNTTLALQETQKTVNADLQSPVALHYKGITITPGGFLAAEFVHRSRGLAADINTPFNSIPLPGSSQTALGEFFGSGRQSRVSMLAEGKLKSAKISGYVEADFLSAAVTSNNNQSNSYSMRQRQAWGQAAFDNGWSFTGGQMWSLVTETKHGVDNRAEALPMVIDAQYTAGFSWARQFGFRLAKNFNNKVWLAVAMENPQATITSHGNAANFLVGSLGASGGLYNAFNGNYAFNPSPDIIAKAVFEPGFGHYEVFGIYSRFRDRAFPCGEVASTDTCGGQDVGVISTVGAFNNSKNGGGFGANARWSFANKRLDFGLHALEGDGIGRYGSAGLPDASVHANGTLDLVRSYQGLGTIEWHAKNFDIYLNGGAEYAGRAADFDPVSGKYVGYGSPLFANSSCFSEPLPGSGGFSPGSLGSNCTGDTRVLIEGSAGFWYRLYNGPKGKLQFGPQYSYVTRNTWSGVGGEPHGVENMIFTSFRYYLP